MGQKSNWFQWVKKRETVAPSIYLFIQKGQKKSKFSSAFPGASVLILSLNKGFAIFYFYFEMGFEKHVIHPYVRECDKHFRWQLVYY